MGVHIGNNVVIVTGSIVAKGILEKQTIFMKQSAIYINEEFRCMEYNKDMHRNFLLILTDILINVLILGKRR